MAVGAMAGCGGGAEPAASPKANIIFRAGAADARPAGGSTAASSVTKSDVPAGESPTKPAGLVVTDTRNRIVIERVSLTLQDIDMERTTQSVDCKDGVAGPLGDCSDWVDGPIRVELNLADPLQGHPLEIPLQAGTYDVISFDISEPDGGDPAERAYLEANRDMRGASVLVTGTFNGQPFTFTTDVRGDREVQLVPPLHVTADGPVTFSFAVEFNVRMWFLRHDGSLIDPRTQVEDDRERIKQNIRDHIESESLP
jgi:hypothetical protein